MNGTVWQQRWEKLEEKILTKKNLLWFGAFLKSSSISLAALSLIWAGLELVVAGERNPNGIDTVIAFLAAFAIGFFYAQDQVKKSNH